MIKWARKIVCTFLLSLLLIGLPVVKVSACGPDFPYSIIFNTAHPDFPLKYFAAGNLGVIQPGWAKSYLCVAYRYLTNNPLDSAEQTSILKLWNRRLAEMQGVSGETFFDEIDAYLQLRAKALGTDDKKMPALYSSVDLYSHRQRINPDAFRLARCTLEDRIKRYGLKSKEVREWMQGQDVVFGVGTDGKAVPPPLPNNFDILMRADRSYQIAAATFYSKSYDKAAELFNEIAKDKQSPWQKLASYLVVRCKANLIFNGCDDKQREEAIVYIKGLIHQTVDPNVRDDLIDLLAPITYTQMDSRQIIDHLVGSVTNQHGRRFGGDVGDLTFMMDEARINSDDQQKGDDKKDSGVALKRVDEVQNHEQAQDKGKLKEHDLTEWLETIQQTDNYYSYYSFIKQKQQAARAKENANLAIQKWRYTKSQPWLVAAMCSNTLRSLELKDMYEAAVTVPPSSPAYLTARFFVIDALIHSNKNEQARQLLKPILLRKDLSPTTRNLFKAQLLKIASSQDEYFRAAIMAPPESSYGNLILPKDWQKRQRESSYSMETPTVDYPVAKDWNRNLPLSLWMKLSKDKSILSEFRGRIVRCTWLRAQLVNKPQQARELSTDLVAAYPMLARLIKKYHDAPEGDAKRFALAYLILKTYGMTPYLQSGIERHGQAINEFDFYNANFWLPLAELPTTNTAGNDYDDDQSVMAPGSNPIMKMVQDYYKPGVARVLKKQEILSANSERIMMAKVNPSKFLGDSILAWAKSHPHDSLIPEALYRVVRLPKWTAHTEVGSQYSRKAYIVLHTQYGGSPWARKTVCWY